MSITSAAPYARTTYLMRPPLEGFSGSTASEAMEMESFCIRLRTYSRNTVASTLADFMLTSGSTSVTEMLMMRVPETA